VSAAATGASALIARLPPLSGEGLILRLRPAAWQDSPANTATADELGLAHVQFQEGLAESLPVPGCWADVVISNGVINLCADKQAVFAEIFWVLRPGGRLQFADIANSRPLPAGALRDIDLWTG